MKQRETKSEFFIGYLNQSLPSIRHDLQVIIVAAMVVAVCISSVAVYYQKKVSPGVFEFGENSVIYGVYHSNPVPHITRGGNTAENILLLATGKHGFRESEKELSAWFGSLEGKSIEVAGFRIIRGGMTALQVNDNRDIKIIEALSVNSYQDSSTTYKSIDGEIVDPKCFLGVMKPGEGVAHAPCAIRCIAGGIPATFSSNGELYILTGNHVQIKPELISGAVGRRIRLSGTVIKNNNWLLLELSSASAQELEHHKQTLSLIDGRMAICR